MEERGEKSGRGRREQREEKRALSYWPVSHTHTEVDGHRTHIKWNGFTFVRGRIVAEPVFFGIILVETSRLCSL